MRTSAPWAMKIGELSSMARSLSRNTVNGATSVESVDKAARRASASSATMSRRWRGLEETPESSGSKSAAVSAEARVELELCVTNF